IEYRDMITIVRDRVRDLIEAGRSLEQVKAAAPAKGYVGRYGNERGDWTTDTFVEAVYRSLMKEKSGGDRGSRSPRSSSVHSLRPSPRSPSTPLGASRVAPRRRRRATLHRSI